MLEDHKSARGSRGWVKGRASWRRVTERRETALGTKGLLSSGLAGARTGGDEMHIEEGTGR